MFELVPRIALYMLQRHFGWPRMLPISLTLSPSPRCNSRCLTCNIWTKREDELALAEWEAVLRSLGRTPFWFTISGGEPFMYKELVQLCQAAYAYCRPGIINIPTNSLMYSIIPGKVAQICESCPETQIIINLSLDGVGTQHDQIRNVHGNFEKFERNFAALRALDYPNLSIGIHSVISRFNVKHVDGLFDYALGLQPDAYITEVAERRSELDTVGIDITPPADQYAIAIDKLIDRISRQQFGGISRITEAFRLEYYRLVKRILSEETQVIGCYAGWASAHIYANGEVWPCCVRGESGWPNLRQVGYDFRRVWFSPAADQTRASIKARECHCPLANASYTNMLMHPPTLARVASRVALSELTWRAR